MCWVRIGKNIERQSGRECRDPCDLPALRDLLFFSSRRRHTRFKCDWSSEVCSSDLMVTADGEVPLFHHTLEGDAMVLIAGIGVMKQWNLAIGSDHHGQSQKAKMVVPLFPMAALRQLGPQVETVEEGEEIGGIKQQAA